MTSRAIGAGGAAGKAQHRLEAPTRVTDIEQTWQNSAANAGVKPQRCGGPGLAPTHARAHAHMHTHTHEHLPVNDRGTHCYAACV